MAKRHGHRVTDLEGLFLRLEELVLANSAEDAFAIVFPLLIAKLWDERSGRTRRFLIHASAEATYQAVVTLLHEADRAWPGVIEHPVELPLTPAHLAICAEPLIEMALAEASLEILDALFEYLIAKAAKGRKGQYFTPRHVVEFCVRVLDPQPGERIADPACGSGGFLLQAFHHVRERHGLHAAAARQFASAGLWGFDFDARAARVARALLVFSGAEAANIFRLNSLLRPEGPLHSSAVPALTIEAAMVQAGSCPRTGYDVILTNPPFAGEVKESEYICNYHLARGAKKIERDILFVERCVELLSPGGRMAIVLPDNKFSSRSYAHVRTWLLQETRILGAVGLGRHTFLPHTDQKASILFLQKLQKTEVAADRTPHDPKLFFAISERPGKNSRGQPILRAGSTPDQPAWTRLDHDLGEIVVAFQRFLKSEAVTLGAG